MGNNFRIDRYTFISVIILVLFSVMTLSYAKLTLIEGAKYREISDSKRVRTITTTAPRGEIRDRNGVLLAGNRASFTVQILKDALNSLKHDEKNEVNLELIRLLESDGADYLNEFPINVNTLRYKSSSEEMSGDLNPIENIVDIVIENNLVFDVLNCDLEEYRTSDFYKFTIGDRMFKYIAEKEGEIPLDFSKNSEGYALSYKPNLEMKDWFQKRGFDYFENPYSLVLEYIKKDRNFLRKAISNPISRKCVYDMLSSKGYLGNIEVADFTISYDDNYERQKRYLMSLSDKITETTSPTDDFVHLFEEYALNDFAKKVYPKTEDSKARSIQQDISNFLYDKGIKSKIKVSISGDGKYNTYEYEKDFVLEGIEPHDYFIELLKVNNLVKEFVCDDRNKYLAQNTLLEKGINPRILIGKDPFEYVYQNDKTAWLKAEGIEDTNQSPAEIFKFLREKYKIPEDISAYEARAMLSINMLIKNQGYLAYQPINFAYDVSERTVARLREGFGNKTGIQISVEPVRYYPYNQVGSHILGYIGKISQANEISNYVDGKGYQKSDLIGKTGLEHAFEDVLRGKPGKKVIEIDAVGNTTAEIEEEYGVQGNTLYTSHDIELQKFVEEKMIETMKAIRTAGVYESEWGDYQYEVDKKTKEPYQANTGATIVQKVQTGEILAMASVPSFNPNLFATGISTDDYDSLIPENEKDLLAPRPLYNIATQTAIQPGSVFKMITALSALDKGWDPNRRIKDMGYIQIGDRKSKCWLYNQYNGALHGRENLSDAIKDSCNYYFFSLALGESQRTGEKLGMKITIDDITSMAKKFGLDDKTGIEIRIPSEFSGGVPSPEKNTQLARANLNYFLRNNLKHYVKDSQIYNQEEAIEEILSWVYDEVELTRNGIIKKLDKLGLEPLKPLEGRREGLADLLKYTYLKDARWTISDTINVTIGQGKSMFTPIQISNYVSTIANGGKLYDLTLVNSIRSPKGEVLEKKEPDFEQVEVGGKDSIAEVTKGMKALVTEGSIKSIFKDLPISVAAKTGSAEKEGINPATGKEYSAFAWFTAYAPADDPEIAVTTLIIQGRTGSNAAPMARDIIAEYFKLEPPVKPSDMKKAIDFEE